MAQAKGQIREGLRYVRSELDLWVPLVMMAIIGTFAINFPVVFPLFVKPHLGGTDTMFTISVGGRARLAARRAGGGAADEHLPSRRRTRGGAVRRGHDGDGGVAVARPRRSRRRLFVGFASIVVHHDDDGDRATRHRTR